MNPDEPPKIANLEIAARSEPAMFVGGDYYDFMFSADKKRLFIAIADVSGKGVSAGLLMVEARSIFHTLTSQNLSTDEMIIIANRQIYADTLQMDTPMMITMLLMEWHLEQEKLSYTGAGHEHILIYRGNSKSIDSIKCGGLWLGVEDEIEDLIIHRTLAINSGDTILLYTDGVTECHNPAAELFGLEELKDFLQKNGHKAPHDIVA
ncbi:MAG: serine/threonine-protein phosphatase, partial [candidate division Zixibacteria bacterium]|nr:serine/threonine-protein phosphatase [candidate division Zixibacteria bacterium]